MLKSAILGLGQVGSRFDEEPRPAIWSHAGAYLAQADRVRLVAGCDINARNRDLFQARSPDARVFADALEMVAETQPDILSICTPPHGRSDLIDEILSVHCPSVLICEKPMETDAVRRQVISDACARHGVKLLVNYNRRYAAVYRKSKALLASGQLGPIRAITVHASNRLWSIGSHAVNILLYFSGENPEAWSALPLPALRETGEPACDLLCRFGSGAAGRVLTVGTSDKLIFEVDIIAERGRIKISGNGTRAEVSRFSASDQYVGYQVLGPTETVHETDPAESTFTTLITEACAIATGAGRPSSTGNDSLDSESLIDQMTTLSDRD